MKLTFNPDKTAGVKGGPTTSIMHVKVLENATSQPYTFPISATIFLPPVINSNDSKNAPIIKFTNYTITVSPPLSIIGQIKNFFSDWLNPQTGIFGVIVATLTSLGWRIWNKQK